MLGGVVPAFRRTAPETTAFGESGVVAAKEEMEGADRRGEIEHLAASAQVAYEVIRADAYDAVEAMSSGDEVFHRVGGSGNF